MEIAKKCLLVVISGSFRKHLANIQQTIREFTELGGEVLSPKLSDAVNLEDEFVILETDTNSDPRILEQRHLDAISASDILYICNINGYMGTSATIEFGYALALRKPIYTKEEVSDTTWREFCEVASPKEIYGLSKMKNSVW